MKNTASRILSTGYFAYQLKGKESSTVYVDLYRSRDGGKMELLTSCTSQADAAAYGFAADEFAAVANPAPVATVPACDCGKPGEWRGPANGRREFACPACHEAKDAASVRHSESHYPGNPCRPGCTGYRKPANYTGSDVRRDPREFEICDY